MRNQPAAIFSGAGTMLLQSSSKFLLKILESRASSGPEKGVDLDCHSVEFDDVRYHLQYSVKSPQLMLISVSLPSPPPETVFIGGLPFGAIEAIKTAYGSVVQILDPPKDGYNLTMKLNLTKLPSNEEQRRNLLVKISSVREIVLGAPLKVVLKHLAVKTVAPNLDSFLALVHRPKESYFVLPQADRVTVVYPMRFKDSVDTVVAISFLQEFVEARKASGMNSAPSCTWSPSPPPELKRAPADALDVNAGFVTFGNFDLPKFFIFHNAVYFVSFYSLMHMEVYWSRYCYSVILPSHVDGAKLDKTVWCLSTFHAYVSYHVKSTEAFMHTRMRRRVESLIQALDRAKPDTEKSQAQANALDKPLKQLSLKESRGGSNSIKRR